MATTMVNIQLNFYQWRKNHGIPYTTEVRALLSASCRRFLQNEYLYYRYKELYFQQKQEMWLVDDVAANESSNQ